MFLRTLTSFIQPSVHDAVFDLHVSGEVSLQRELARAVKAFERLAVWVEVHVAHQVVHPVELLPTKLQDKREKFKVGSHYNSCFCMAETHET